MSNRYSRIFHHISAKDLKRNREIMAEKKIEEQRIKEEERIISEKFRYSWRRELEEGMTSSGIFTTVLSPEGDTAIDSVNTTDAASYQPTSGVIDSGDNLGALTGTTIRSSGSGFGNDDGFDVGGEYLAFQGTSDRDNNRRFAALAPIDSTRIDTLTISAIVGNGSNGGRAPIGSSMSLFLYYKTPAMDDAFPIYLSPSLELGLSGDDQYLINTGDGFSNDGGLNNYSQTIPEYARAEGTRFILFQNFAVDENGNKIGANYGVTDIKFQRRVPMSVVIPLDDPQAISFINVGTKEGDPKKRKKKLQDQLDASETYLKKQFGDDFPSGAKLTSDDEIQASPIGKREVSKNFADFSTQAASAQPQTAPQAEPTSPSSQTTMTPTNDDGDPIPVKPVGGKNSGVVQGADAATLRDDLAKAHADLMTKHTKAMAKAEAEGASPESLEALAVRQYQERKPLEDALEMDSPVPSMPSEPIEPEEPEEPKPEELKASEEEKEGKTEEEVEEIEREKYEAEEQKQVNKILDSLLNFAKQIDPLDMPIDLAIDVALGIVNLGKGVNQIRSFLKKLSGGRFGSGRGILIDPDEALASGRHQKFVNNLEIMRSNLTGRITTQDYDSRQISDLAKSLTVSKFMGDNFYGEFGGNYGISDERHEYVDDNIYVKDGKVYTNDQGLKSLANMDTGVRSIDGIGRGYGQMIIPKDGSKPYFHFYDYNYHNLNSSSPTELPDDFITKLGANTAQVLRSFLPGRLFDDVINRIQGNLDTFGKNLKTRVGLDGWPPGIHGATLTDFKIPLDQLPKETQEFISSHPLYLTPERMANMSQKEVTDQLYSVLKTKEAYDDYFEYHSDITRMSTEPVNTVPYAVAMGEIEKIYSEFEPQENKFKELLDKPYEESPLFAAERAAYDDMQTLEAQNKKDIDAINKKYGLSAQNALYDKLVKPLRDSVRSTLRSGGTVPKVTMDRLDRQYEKFKKQADQMRKDGSRIRREINDKFNEQYDKISEFYNSQAVSNSLKGYEGYAITVDEKGRGDYTTLNGKVIKSRFSLTRAHVEKANEVDARAEALYNPVADLLKYVDGNYVREAKIKEFKNKFKMTGESWSPKKKGSGGVSSSNKPKPKPKPRGSYFGGFDAGFIGSGGSNRKKNQNEEVLLKYARPQPSSDLYEKLKKQFFNPKDIKPTFPENPPPVLDPKTGMHPNYGKTAARYKKLDPASANAMPLTGDPETDAVVDKQRTKPRPKNSTTFSKLKKIRKRI